jgi:hypothetical protein
MAASSGAGREVGRTQLNLVVALPTTEHCDVVVPA